MTESDLRTGNLLNYDTSEGETLPTKIDWHDLKWLSKDPKGFNLVHTPITLTDEWLVKFGFEKDGQGFVNKIILYGENDFRYNASFFEYHSLISVKYVHQLQNLFFALLGEELKQK